MLAALALLALFGGAALFALLVLVTALALSWEWARITRGGFDLIGVAIASCVAAAIVLAGLEFERAALLALGGAMAALGAIERRVWAPLGVAWIGLPCIALIWLRQRAGGEQVIFWLLLVVWMTDTGAMAAGRAIGGPKLAPRISPNKTWAGLIGAICAAAATSVALAAVLHTGSGVAAMALAGAAAAVIAQAGDLAESFVKRRFGVKDASDLIPGHGGVFDRVDGLLAAALAVALWMIVRGPAV